MVMCSMFKDNIGGTHYCELEGHHMWQMMFYNAEGESCAVNGTDEEVAVLLTDGLISEILLSFSLDSFTIVPGNL